ncbi:hyaluronoglucuronidase [Patella vulgata]|uniref:hyaluronoglucuronidase n=1 Tax=Patella vulgata TaxID=6465 RepID=UPI0024A7D984|nr:hyaluronoglucuronidase [Patella vulgata]
MKALTPCYMRVGGTSADYMAFNETSQDHILKVSDWDQLNRLTREAGWDLIFGLNLRMRKNGHWDPKNALKLFQYTIKKGYHVAGWELGNEPEYHHPEKFTEENIAYNFGRLRTILDSIPQLKPYVLVGPDVTHVQPLSPYYMDAKKAEITDFYDVAKLDEFKTKWIAPAMSIARNRGVPLWLGETSSAYGGGVVDMSDRYVAGYMWLDKLGVAASLGVKIVLRQDLIAGNYALLDGNYHPFPDYWLTVLYKRLVGSPVLTPPTSNNKNVRIYAHCTNTHSSHSYRRGSVTIYMMNFMNTQVMINLGPFSNKPADVYILTPGPLNGLKSSTVKLNGKELLLLNDLDLPPLSPQQHTGDIQVGRKAMAFIVVPDANHQACL